VSSRLSSTTDILPVALFPADRHLAGHSSFSSTGNNAFCAGGSYCVLQQLGKARPTQIEPFPK